MSSESIFFEYINGSTIPEIAISNKLSLDEVSNIINNGFEKIEIENKEEIFNETD